MPETTIKYPVRIVSGRNIYDDSGFFVCECQCQGVAEVLVTSLNEAAALRGKLTEAEKQLACYRQYLGEVTTYGADAESLDKMLGECVERRRELESTLADIRERVERALACQVTRNMTAIDIHKKLAEGKE